MTLYPHQDTACNQCYDILKRYGIVYLFGEPRSGKTLTALVCAEKFCNNNYKKTILILTKKSAIPGWTKCIESMQSSLDGLTVLVSNYEQASKMTLKPDIYIQDESHNIGRVGKSSKRFKDIKSLCYSAPAILLSGTPVVESPLSIYYQMGISKYSPFDKYSTFYKFFNEYGVPSPKRIGALLVESYSKCKDSLLDDIEKYIVRMTLADAGHTYTHKDIIHYFEPSNLFKNVCKSIIKKRSFKGRELDSISALRTFLHLFESGLYYTKTGDYVVFPRYAKLKVNYLLNNFMGKKTAVMCYFKAEQDYLSDTLRLLPNFKIFSSTADCEGVDLSDYDELVIFSQDYSGAKFIQRRNRIVNLNSAKHTKVHYLIFKNGLSEQIYNCVAKKKTFNDSMFNKDIYNDNN